MLSPTDSWSREFSRLVLEKDDRYPKTLGYGKVEQERNSLASLLGEQFLSQPTGGFCPHKK
jgi:hypothetical protein